MQIIKVVKKHFEKICGLRKRDWRIETGEARPSH